MSKKRFYKTVTVAPFESEFAVMLDGKPIRTPVGTVLKASEKLAKAMADEWESQKETINPDFMPVTRIISIALDRVPQDRAALIDDIVRYANSDLLCYRGEDALRAAQERLHDPVLVWAKGKGITLQVTDGVMPVEQPIESLQAVRTLLESASDIELAALAMATPLLGSALLALSLWLKHLPVDQAIECARIDEDFQASHWGEDSEAKAQWLKRERDIRGCAVVFTHFS
jgi:chaperone required for assembly of F1-ATPase